MPTTKKLGAFSLADILTGQMFIYIDVQLSVVYSSGPFGFGKRTGNCVCHYDLKAEVWKREDSYVQDGLWITALQLWGMIDPIMLSEQKQMRY